MTIIPDTLTRAPPMTERQLQAAIRDMAGWLGWLVYCTYDSRKSPAGYPDLTLVHPGQRRVIWAELKSERGRATPDQARWIAALRAAGAEVHIWRPEDWTTGRIEMVLTGG